MINNFRPQLAPNETIAIDDIEFPMFASIKLDGIRNIMMKGDSLTRSLKAIPNKQLKEKFEPLSLFAKKYNLILDGEIYTHGMPFQMINSCVMTQDYTEKKSIKKWEDLQRDYVFDITREEALSKLKFHCFDIVEENNFDTPFHIRYKRVKVLAKRFPSLYQPVYQLEIYDKESLIKTFNEALDAGYEGLMLKSFNGYYKCGRATMKEGLVYKLKPYKTYDNKVIGIVQATKVDESAEKKINELGYSVTSKKKDDRILIPRASAVWVLHEGEKLKVTLAMTDKEKEYIWNNQKEFIGKTIEYKGLEIGMKDLPRHPTSLKWRDDK